MLLSNSCAIAIGTGDGYRLPSTSVPLTAPKQVLPEYGIRRPVLVTSTVPLSAIEQLLLPGTEPTAVPLHVMLLPETDALAEPLPDTFTLPLHVAENDPDTPVAVIWLMVH